MDASFVLKRNASTWWVFFHLRIVFVFKIWMQH